jgi:hypothetical protein
MSGDLVLAGFAGQVRHAADGHRTISRARDTPRTHTPKSGTHTGVHDSGIHIVCRRSTRCCSTTSGRPESCGHNVPVQLSADSEEFAPLTTIPNVVWLPAAIEPSNEALAALT